MREQYIPKEEPMRVVPLFSGGASGAYDLLERPSSLYEIVGCLCSTADAKGIARLGLKHPIPIIVYDVHAHYSKAKKPIIDMDERLRFENKLKPFLEVLKPDILIGSGWMFTTVSLHKDYPILNVHPADLVILVDGKRKYTGDHAVFDAILAGEKETRSTVHLMEDQVDEGPIVVRSEALRVPYKIQNLAEKIDYELGQKIFKAIMKSKLNVQDIAVNNIDITDISKLHDSIKANKIATSDDRINVARLIILAEEHQTKMKAECDTPAFAKSLELIAEKGLSQEVEVLYLGEEKLPYGGVLLGD